MIAQAEFYMRELERRESAAIAARDYQMAMEDRNTNAVIAARDLKLAQESRKMEVWVIVLIGAELLLALIGLWYGVHEGNRQQALLGAMNASTGETAKAMKDAANSLKTLSDDQKTANGNVQLTLDQTKSMATALKQQLDILKQEQAARQAEQSKKPKLELLVGAGMLNVNATEPVPVPPRSETDTSQTFDFHLRNGGNATALNGVLRVVIFATDVDLIGNNFQALTDEANTQGHTYLLPFARLRPGINVPTTITFSFPKGRAPFAVLFNVDDDESDSGTYLGALNIVPKKPADTTPQ